MKYEAIIGSFEETSAKRPVLLKAERKQMAKCSNNSSLKLG